jgi:hypothetical protein
MLTRHSSLSVALAFSIILFAFCTPVSAVKQTYQDMPAIPKDIPQDAVVEFGKKVAESTQTTINKLDPGKDYQVSYISPSEGHPLRAVAYYLSV